MSNPGVVDPIDDGQPVTRVELVDLLASAFGESAIGRDRLIAVAEQREARAPALHVLRSLPPRRYLRPQDLWADLPFLPVDR